MKCPQCGAEMHRGSVKIRDISLFHEKLVVTWTPEKDAENAPEIVHLKLNAPGYYCEECMKVFAALEESDGVWSRF